ncbi:MAG: ribonuclease Y [bacterium]|nr:ribonuclease Y [bacterium]
MELTSIFIVGLIAVIGYLVYRDLKRAKKSPNDISDVALSSQVDTSSASLAETEKILKEANQKARELVLEAKDESYKIKKTAEEEIRQARKEFLNLENRLQQKEESLDKKLTSVENREANLINRQTDFDTKTVELEKIKAEQLARLERAALLTREEAKALILEATEKSLKDEIAKKVRQAEQEAKIGAKEKVKDILVTAMLHGATDYVPEYTSTRVKLVDEDMKGRIIGKEGRNIRAFEMATGVDVEIDETPGEILLSSFDSIRRAIAKKSLERLMADGRIQPIKIEEIVEKTRKEEEKLMREEGEKLCEAVGVYNLPVELVELLGRFKHRFSYGQSMITHTLEETKIGIVIAKEVGADVDVVKLACLFHDIGKVVNDEEGTHIELGVKLLKQFRFPDKVIRAVAEHHEDEPFSSAESMIVYIADAISGSRPGARHESVQEYIDRLRMEEDTVYDIAGKENIERVFAVQAGRELRVLVKASQIDESESVLLSKKIAKELEVRLKNFPGQIKVTVVRETRAVATAR